MDAPLCPYCNIPAALIDSSVIYHKSYGHAWLCEWCRAYVGCHSGTTRPLGTLANAELRAWRRKAHEVFDVLWRAKMRRDKCPQHEARTAGYRWLAAQMGMTTARCHIGWFNVDECQQVVRLCTQVRLVKNRPTTG